MLFKSTLLLSILSALLLSVQGHDVEEPEDNGLDCCSQLFVSSEGILSKVQGSLLGKYVLDGVDQRKNLIYSKTVDDEVFYLYYRVNGEYEHGTNGWTIGHLDGNSFHIVTRNSNPVCPEGINGAYDRDITHDSTFNIACHSEKVKIDCCPKVKISSSSVVAKAQSAHLGEYSLDGSHNGYPLYYKKSQDVESYLFYRKTGLPMDGWTISPKSPSSPLFAITTRSKTYCPNEVTKGFNLNKEKDSTFRITCSAKIPLDDEDDSDDQSSEEGGDKSMDGASDKKTSLKDQEREIKKKPRNAKNLPDDFQQYPIAAGSSLGFSFYTSLLSFVISFALLH